MGETLEEKCGLCVAHTLHDAYGFLKSLQHRGKDASGIAVVGKQNIDVVKWIGTVSSFSLHVLHTLLGTNEPALFMGHLRYGTRGSKDELLENAHPHVVGGTESRENGHIILRGCDAVMVHNGQVADSFFDEKEAEGMKTNCDTEKLLHLFMQNGIDALISKIPGSYTAAFARK